MCYNKLSTWYGYESRKNCLDGAWLNPKHFIIGNQQPSLKGKVQRLSPLRRVGTSVPKWCAPLRG
jgi:hypothetical protein